MQPLLTINDLNFQFNDKKILFKNLSLVIDKPMCIGLIGKNGSGKTTLLKLITGLLSPPKGVIRVYGRKILSHTDAKECTYVPENAKLFIVSPTPRKELLHIIPDQNKVNQILKDFNLEKFADQKIYQLSEGQRRLLALVAAFQLEKKVILIDEPTIGLDLNGRGLLLKLIKKAIEEGKICIVSSNDQRLFPLFDELLVLRGEGEIDRGTPRDVLYRIGSEIGLLPSQIPRLIQELSGKTGLNFPKLISVNEFNSFLQGSD